MKKTICLLIALIPLILLAQVKIENPPQKELGTLTTSELNKLFSQANSSFKKKAIKTYADSVCKKLNGTMLIAKDDVVWAKRASGVKILGKADQRISENTCFELASVSKSVTAAAVLQLVEEGKVSLNDYMGKYFSDFPYGGITVQHLLAHTSGLPEYFDFKESWFPVGRLTTNQDVVDVLKKYKPEMLFAPGTKYKYTNTNYALLVLIVEKASGMRFEDYARKNIFEPAGMENSFYITERAAQIGCSIAVGHKADGIPQEIKGLDGTFGDKGLYSTVGDLFAWKKAYFRDYKIISKEMVEAATSQQNNLRDNKMPSELYGYGWHIEMSPCYGKLIYHGGLWHGYHHILLYYPAENIFMVFLSNYCNRAHRGQTAVVLHIMCGA